MPSWLFNVQMAGVIKEVKLRFQKRDENRDSLASCIQITWFCSDSEKNMKIMVGNSVKVCKRRDLKMNPDKGKVNVLRGEGISK